jgi:hypothetical protein
MQNPFEIIANRLNNIEALLLDIKHPTPAPVNNEPYGDFNWLRATCPGIPTSTLRIKSAAGDIPGVVKFGKRVLYEKAAVLGWLQSQTRQPVDQQAIERETNAAINSRLADKSSLPA